MSSEVLREQSPYFYRARQKRSNPRYPSSSRVKCSTGGRAQPPNQHFQLRSAAYAGRVTPYAPGMKTASALSLDSCYITPNDVAPSRDERVAIAVAKSKSYRPKEDNSEWFSQDAGAIKRALALEVPRLYRQRKFRLCQSLLQQRISELQELAYTERAAVHDAVARCEGKLREDSSN